MSNATTQAPEAVTPDSPEIVITIAGRAATGKSTLAMFIALCLEKVDIEVAEIQNEDTLPEALAATFQERLKHLAGRKPKVVINMTQLRRDQPRLILPGA